MYINYQVNFVIQLLTIFKTIKIQFPHICLELDGVGTSRNLSI